MSVNGLRNGFRISFNPSAPLRSAPNNMGSARLHAQVITDYLVKGIRLGRMLGPFKESGALNHLQINHFGVIPKGHQTG